MITEVVKRKIKQLESFPNYIRIEACFYAESRLSYTQARKPGPSQALSSNTLEFTHVFWSFSIQASFQHCNLGGSFSFLIPIE